MWGVSGPDRAIRVPPRPRTRWRGLEGDQVKALLARARTDWPRGGVVYLGIYLGLRREEIAGIRWRDFDDDLSWVRILGKGDRTRYLPVHDRVREMLAPQRWPGEYVFPGRLGGHITPATVSKWVSEISIEAGIGHVSPHQMRHTFGAKVNDGSRDIYLAKDMLGHVDVKTTEVYTRMELDRLQQGTRWLDWEDDEDDSQAA